MTTNHTTATPAMKEIEILASSGHYWLECGKLHQFAEILEEIESLAANEQAASTAPAEPLAAQLAAALAWSLDTLTEYIRPDGEMWEQIDTARELIDLAQPSAADRAPFKEGNQ
jgi:hypothetical protein